MESLSSVAFQFHAPTRCSGGGGSGSGSRPSRHSGPRQGRNIRQCIVSRESLPRQLMYRIVRSRDDEGKVTAHFDAQHVPKRRVNGRSIYISKQLDVVAEATRKNRISRALRCTIPPQVYQDLGKSAKEWHNTTNEEKGLLYCEVYGLDDGGVIPTEQLQDSCLFHTTQSDSTTTIPTTLHDLYL